MTKQPSWCLCDDAQFKYNNFDSTCRHDEMAELHAKIAELEAEHAIRQDVPTCAKPSPNSRPDTSRHAQLVPTCAPPIPAGRLKW